MSNVAIASHPRQAPGNISAPEPNPLHELRRRRQTWPSCTAILREKIPSD
jgi:hypothetical protein